jgi:hypothetical protein
MSVKTKFLDLPEKPQKVLNPIDLTNYITVFTPCSTLFLEMFNNLFLMIITNLFYTFLQFLNPKVSI